MHHTVAEVAGKDFPLDGILYDEAYGGRGTIAPDFRKRIPSVYTALAAGCWICTMFTLPLSVTETRTAARSKTALLTGLLSMAIYTAFRAAIRRHKNAAGCRAGLGQPAEEQNAYFTSRTRRTARPSFR